MSESPHSLVRWYFSTGTRTPRTIFFVSAWGGLGRGASGGVGHGGNLEVATAMSLRHVFVCFLVFLFKFVFQGQGNEITVSCRADSKGRHVKSQSDLLVNTLEFYA